MSDPKLHNLEMDGSLGYDLVIRNAYLEDSDVLNDIAIRNGVIASVGPSNTLSGKDQVDAKAGLVCPAFVDPHTHLDKAFLQPRPNESGSLQEAISIMKEAKGKLLTGSLPERARQALKLAVKNGTLTIRTHVDIDAVNGIRPLEELLKIKEQWSGLVDLQIVAFPQEGVIDDPTILPCLKAAMRLGADAIGGIPAIESTSGKSQQHIEKMFDLAVAFNRPVDMHIDETDDPDSKTLAMLARATMDAGWQSRVNAAHCCSLAAQADDYATFVIELVAQAGISIITNPTANLVLQGRADHQPIRRGITRVKELMRAGVNVACGSDNLQDVFYPFGQADMLEVAFVTALTAQLTGKNELQALKNMPRNNAARCLGLKQYGIEVGNPADLVVLPVRSNYEALVTRPPRRAVIHKGKIICETIEETTYSDRIEKVSQ